MESTMRGERRGGHRFGKRAAAAAVVVLVAAGVVGWLVTGHEGGSTTASVASADMGVAAPTAPGEVMQAADAGSSYAKSAAGGAPIAPEASAPEAQARIVKTADLSLVLADDGFGRAFDAASKLAATEGGFVVDSSTEGTHAKAGTLTIRIPEDRFEQALSSLRALGVEVERESSSGQDVTDQFVDLDARLRSWEAQERVLLRLMDQAKSINETMQVQNQIQQVQFQIESIKGELRVLRDQTSFGTITVSMHERGAAVPKSDAERPSLAVAVDTAVSGFLTVVSLIIVGLGYLVPLGILVFLGWLLWRRARRAATPAADTPAGGLTA